ncbi:MAG: hypothetical protein S4CHLAM123_08920 [Chlamydiales bacterium]|nr:hypothetical protein [Chlamydiales bacterium]
MSVQFPPNSPLQQDLFLSPTKVQSPDKLFTWNVRQSPGGTIDPTPTKEVWDKMVEAGMTGDNIYRIQHTESKRRYIGSALETEKGNHIKKRFSKYKCNTNQYNQKKVAGDKLKQKLQHIEYAMARSPDKMNVAIVAHLEAHPNEPIQEKEERLHLLEDEQVLKYDTLKRKYGYNHSRPANESLRASSDGPAKKKQKTKKQLSAENPTRLISSRAAATRANARIQELNLED